MEYEELLNTAYEKVTPIESCERFEITKVEGHHQGSKTVITNFSRVCTCIRRNPAHLIKFLTKELASSAELSGDRLILSRKLSSKDINEKVAKYVNRFVLCPVCKKPDTELEEVGNRLYIRCLACGEKYEVHRI